MISFCDRDKNHPTDDDDEGVFPDSVFPRDVFPEDVFPSDVFPRPSEDDES